MYMDGDALADALLYLHNMGELALWASHASGWLIDKFGQQVRLSVLLRFSCDAPSA